MFSGFGFGLPPPFQDELTIVDLPPPLPSKKDGNLHYVFKTSTFRSKMENGKPQEYEKKIKIEDGEGTLFERQGADITQRKLKHAEIKQLLPPMFRRMSKKRKSTPRKLSSRKKSSEKKRSSTPRKLSSRKKSSEKKRSSTPRKLSSRKKRSTRKLSTPSSQSSKSKSKSKKEKV